MILTCPHCNAHYKLVKEPENKRDFKIKCAKCGNVFQTDLTGDTQDTGSSILIAHDDFRVVNVIKKLLEPLNFEILTSYDGLEAFNTINEKKPAVAIIDVALQGMFGFELCEKVKTDPSLKSTKVILIASIYDRTRYKRRPQHLYGADEYLEKHHIPDKLFPRVLDLISHKISSRTSIHQSAPESVQKEMLKDNRDILMEKSGAPQTHKPEPPIQKTREEAAKQPAQVLLENKPINIEQQRALIEKNESDVINAITDSSDKAKKLAHIIVSDIALYNQDTISQLTIDNYRSLLKMDVEDGIRHLAKKVPQVGTNAEIFIHKAFEELIQKRKV